MSEHKASPKLAEGASRFDRLIREVKDGQIAQTQKAEPAPAGVSPAFIPSPDEVWARQFMTVSIGPTSDFKPAPKPQKDERKTLRPEPIETQAPAPASPGGTFAPKLPGASGDDRLGASIGRSEPRRSWLGRLFRGR